MRRTHNGRKIHEKYFRKQKTVQARANGTLEDSYAGSYAGEDVFFLQYAKVTIARARSCSVLRRPRSTRPNGLGDASPVHGANTDFQLHIVTAIAHERRFSVRQGERGPTSPKSLGLVERAAFVTTGPQESRGRGEARRARAKENQALMQLRLGYTWVKAKVFGRNTGGMEFSECLRKCHNKCLSHYRTPDARSAGLRFLTDSVQYYLFCGPSC